MSKKMDNISTVITKLQSSVIVLLLITEYIRSAESCRGGSLISK